MDRLAIVALAEDPGVTEGGRTKVRPFKVRAAEVRSGQVGIEEVCTTRVPDEQTLRRMLLAPAGVATLVGPEREDAVRAQIVDAMSPYRTAQGGSRLNDEVHFLVARAGCAARWPDRGGRGRV